MKVVVTGGAGFIGSHVIELLVAKSHEVICVERQNARLDWIRDLPVRIQQCGIHDETRLRRVLQGADAVFHLAGLTEARSPSDFYSVNTEGTACVLRAAAAQPSATPRFILFSSLAALGPCRNGELLSPDTVPFPLSHYGHSKLLAETVVHAWADRVPATILRLPSVYGPRERAVLKLFRMVRHGIALTTGDWDREFSLIYVRDLASALLACALSDRAAGRTYCLAHPERVSWRSFAKCVGQSLGRRPRLVSIPPSAAKVVAVAAEAAAYVRGRAAILNRDRVREITQHRWVCDPSRSIAEFGFSPAYAIDRGINETADWYRRERWL